MSQPDINLTNEVADTRRLDWLLALLWETGRGDEESDAALATLKRLRGRIHGDCAPFRKAIDKAIMEEKRPCL